jgi:chemotaxis protein CheZ
MSLSGDESNVAAFPRHEYEAIEKAVMESARGRWFLQEFAKRNRAADTLTLLEAIGRLQGALAGTMPGSPPPMAEITSLAEAIRSTRADMANARNDRLSDGGVMSDDPAIYARIAEHAKAKVNEIMTGSQRLHFLAGELKAANANDERVSKVEADAQSLEALAGSQELLSQRIAKAMGLLSHVDERVNAIAAMVKPQAVEPRHLKYFAPDETLFEPASKQAASTASPARPAELPPPGPRGATVVVHRLTTAPTSEGQAEPAAAPAATVTDDVPPREESKRRIVIIRKQRSDTIEIPLAGELPEQVA